MVAFNPSDWIGQNSLLGEAGFYNVLLPFLLLFVILYGILSQINLFLRDDSEDGEKKKAKKINGLLALILALFITYSTSYLAWFSSFVATYTGNVAVILIGLLLFFILFGLITGKGLFEFIMDIVGGEDEGKKEKRQMWARIILLLLIAIGMFFVFSGSGGIDNFNPTLPGFAISPQTIILILIIGGLVGLVWWAVSD